MKKRMRGCCLLLAACLTAGLVGCALPEGSVAPSTTLPPAAQSSRPQDETGAAPKTSTAVTLLLPADKAAFGEQLTTLAAADGTRLTVKTQPATESYTGSVVAALEGETPPDFFWLEGEGALDELRSAGDHPLVDFAAEAAGPLMRSLADMVPEASRQPGSGSTTGLPLGYYAEGYLVNLEVLAALLGAEKDTTHLLEDLNACSWDQWRMLVRSIESYLAQPGRIELRLGTRKYTTPAFRPAVAGAMRGVFAVPTQAPEALAGNAVDIIMGLCYSSPMEIKLASTAQKQALLRPVMASLMGLFELETMHMAQAAGPLRRGENYADQTHYDKEGAIELFAGGSALFMRGDSRLGAQIEQANPKLAGKLALVPVKLPPPSYIEEAENMQQEASDTIVTPQLPTEEETDEAAAEGLVPAIPDELAEELISMSNLGLWYNNDGFICVSAKAGMDEQQAIASLLLRLYTTEAGQRLLQEGLGLYPFTNPYPAEGLLRQVAAEVTDTDGSWHLVAPPSSLRQPKSQLGSHLEQNLLNLYIWNDEAQLAFMTAGFAAFGVHYIPAAA